MPRHKIVLEPPPELAALAAQDDPPLELTKFVQRLTKSGISKLHLVEEHVTV